MRSDTVSVLVHADQEAAERSTRFLKILESSMLGFSYQSCAFDASSAKAGCARRVIGQMCPGTLACTLEVRDGGSSQSWEGSGRRTSPNFPSFPVLPFFLVLIVHSSAVARASVKLLPPSAIGIRYSMLLRTSPWRN